LNWRNISISQKYLGSFSVAAFLFIISGIIVFMQLTVAEQDISTFESEATRAHDISTMESLLQQKDIQIADFIITENDKYVDEFYDLLDEFNELTTKLESSMDTSDQRDTFNLIVKNDKEINEIFFKIIEDDDISSALTVVRRNEANLLRYRTVHLINELIDNINEEQAETMTRANNSMN